jgi:hypothetical protein
LNLSQSPHFEESKTLLLKSDAQYKVIRLMPGSTKLCGLTEVEIKIVEGVHDRWGAGDHEYWLTSRPVSQLNKALSSHTYHYRRKMPEQRAGGGSGSEIN